MDPFGSTGADQAFLEAAEVSLHLLDDPAVRARWTEASALPAMSVGALACHLGRQTARVAQLLMTTPSSLPVLASAEEHYARAAWVVSTSTDDPVNDRSDDDAQAALGHPAMIGRVTGDLVAASRILQSGEAEEIVPVPWQGWALRRPDFLLTRLVEVVVHSADLAVSVAQAPPEFPDDSFRPVCDLLVRLAVRRHGQGAIISTLSRRERSQIISAF